MTFWEVTQGVQKFPEAFKQTTSHIVEPRKSQTAWAQDNQDNLDSCIRHLSRTATLLPSRFIEVAAPRQGDPTRRGFWQRSGLNLKASVNKSPAQNQRRRIAHHRCRFYPKTRRRQLFVVKRTTRSLPTSWRLIKRRRLIRLRSQLGHLPLRQIAAMDHSTRTAMFFLTVMINEQFLYFFPMVWICLPVWFWTSTFVRCRLYTATSIVCCCSIPFRVVLWHAISWWNKISCPISLKIHSFISSHWHSWVMFTFVVPSYFSP